jgi:hypothetical protein
VRGYGVLRVWAPEGQPLPTWSPLLSLRRTF